MWRQGRQCDAKRIIRSTGAVQRKRKEDGWCVTQLWGVEVFEKLDRLVVLAQVSQSARELESDLMFVLGVEASG